jgi:hypothetical protein
MSEGPDEIDSWELRRGITTIGKLVSYDQDMFWYSCHFDPTPEFEPYKQLFSEGAALITDEQQEEWGAWYEKINSLGLQMIRLRDGEIASEFILYINENDAHFRPRFDTFR